MSARESSAVERAVAEALTAGEAASLRALAAKHEIALSTLRRALRRRGVAPRAHRSGELHHSHSRQAICEAA